MSLRRPPAGRCPKAFPLPVSMLSLPILYSVGLRTLGSTSQLALEQFSARESAVLCTGETQLYVTDRFRRTSWMVLHLLFSHCWTWDQWCSEFKCWAVTCDKGLWPAWWFGCGGERPSTARGDELQGGLDMSCQESWIMGLRVLRFQPLCSCLSNWLWFTPWQISQHYYDLIAQGGICSAQISP